MKYSLSSRTIATEIFIQCERNFKAFVASWEQQSEQSPPSRSTLYRFLSRFRTAGEVKDKKRSGRRRIRDDDLVATVGAYFFVNPGASINTFVKEFEYLVSRTTVWRILRFNLQMKPFKPRRVHRLLPGDDVKRYWCLDALLTKINDEPTFLSNIIWSDECAFKLNGTIATNNMVNWAQKNPHYTFERSTNRTGIMVFAAISAIGVVCIGFFDEMMANQNRKLKNSVRKESYKEMINRELIPGLSNIFPTDEEKQQMVFMQDGAAPHNISETLNLHFGHRWIGNANHQAPIYWPSRSPDLTPMGLSLFFNNIFHPSFYIPNRLFVLGDFKAKGVPSKSQDYQRIKGSNISRSK